MQPNSGNTRRLFTIAKEKKIRWMFLGVLVFIQAITIIAMMYSLSVILHDLFLLQKNLEEVSLHLYIFAILIGTRALITWVQRYLSTDTALLLKHQIQKQLFEKTLCLGTVWAESRNSGEQSSIFVDGVDNVTRFYSSYIPALITMLVIPLSIALYVFITDWLSGLLLLITGPLIPVFMSFIGMKASEDTQKQWKSLKRLSHFFLDSIQGLRTLKVFQHVNKRTQLIFETSNAFRKDTMSILRIAFLSALVLELFAAIATALLAVEIGVRLIENLIDYQTGLFILLLAPDYYLPFRSFGAQHHTGMEAKEASRSIFDFLDEIPSTTPISEPIDFPNPPYHISFDNVTFTYPGQSQPTLVECSFTIPATKWTSLAGKSGSGKSTIVRLLLKHHQPDNGRILLNGTPINQLSDRKWFDVISMLSQHIWLFNNTIMNNLKIAQPGASINEIEEATSKAGIHDVITQLPHSYQYEAGERGLLMSGGERQRFALARALLKKSSILMLDEMTSAMDPFLESEINTTLSTIIHNQQKTLLIIAHRLSTLKMADHIVFLDQGKADEGSHSELIIKNATYKSLFSK